MALARVLALAAFEALAHADVTVDVGGTWTCAGNTTGGIRFEPSTSIQVPLLVCSTAGRELAIRC